MSSFQHKLFHYEEEPPRSAWEGITAALETPEYAQKLKKFEQQPPAHTWEKIDQQLAVPKAKVITLRTKVFKYAIAVAVLTAIATGVVYYVQNQTGSGLAGQPQNGTLDHARTNTRSAAEAKSPSTTKALQPDNASGYSNDTDTETGLSDDAMVHFSSQVRVAKNQVSAQDIDIRPQVKNIIDTELANRYMIATTAAGTAVRLPKKAYSDYACANVYTNTACKEKINSIQNKMAASVATDFTDFIDLLKKLQDNQ